MALSAVPSSKYQPKTFNKQNKYVVKGYQYPEDLMGQTSEQGAIGPFSQYASNYVVFYINVNNEARMLENNEDIVVGIDASDRVKKQLAGKEYTQVEAGAANTAEAAVVAGAFSGGSAKGVALGASAALLGSAAISANTKGSTFSRPQKRLSTAIALHVPNQLSVRYGAGWSEEETMGLQAIIQGGEAAGRAMLEAGKALASKSDSERAAGMEKAKGEIKGVSSIVANVALSKGPNAGAMSAMSGLAPNPMKEQVFKGVDFRTFTMEYQFAPRSRIESDNVSNIIMAFKYHMHPEYKDANNFLFLYPSEFDIEYYHNGEENMNIHRHTSCVLTEMNVNYTPNGNFSTFIEGRPSQINVSLTFKELTVLTKELIAQGL
jgi:hypothetical protein